MKVIYSIFGIFVGIIILGTHFEDLSKLINVFIDVQGFIITLISTIIIGKWLRKDPPDNLLK